MYGTGYFNQIQTEATFVGGKYSHHCAVPMGVTEAAETERHVSGKWDSEQKVSKVTIIPWPFCLIDWNQFTEICIFISFLLFLERLVGMSCIKQSLCITLYMYIGISHENKKKLRAMFITGNDAMDEATSSGLFWESLFA